MTEKPSLFQSIGRTLDYFRSTRRGMPTNAYEMSRFGDLAAHVADLYKSFSTHHDSADGGRLSGNWGTTYDTPYWNLSTHWKTIVARSIRAVDNDPNSKGILNSLVSNVVRTGLRPTPRVKTADGKPVDGINKRLSSLWERYNDEWDATGKQTFYEAQQMVLTEMVRCGTVLTNKVSSPRGNMLGMCTEVLNTLRLDTAHDQSAPKFSQDPRTKQTVFGIELDERGRPLQYHIQGIDNPISARFMRHHYKRLSAEEWIGLPWFSVALKYLWALEKLIEDKLIASRLQAMVGLYMPDELMARLIKVQKNSDNQIEMEPGQIYHGPAGAEPKVIQADDSIREVLNPLQRMLLHAVGMTFGLSYMTFTRDVTEINMAAGKINTNEDHKTYRLVQKFLAKEFCQWEWNWFVYRCFADGMIPGRSITDYIENEWRYQQVQWDAPGFEFVDPYREAQALDVMYKNKMLTLSEHYSQKGMDWREAIDQLDEEASYMLTKKSITKIAEQQAQAGRPAQAGGKNADSNGKSGSNGKSDGNGRTESAADPEYEVLWEK